MITKSSGSAVTGQTITFDASGSRDPEGGPLTFSWSFFDVGIEKSGQIVSYAYSTPRTKTVGLTVTDNEGAKTISSAVIQVTVPKSGPTTTITISVTTKVPTLATNKTTLDLFNATNETTTMVPTEVVTGATPEQNPVPKPALTEGGSIKSSGDTGSGSNQNPGQSPAGSAGGSSINIYVIMGVMAIILVGIFGFIMLKKR
jgi:hypothetical protein